MHYEGYFWQILIKIAPVAQKVFWPLYLHYAINTPAVSLPHAAEPWLATDIPKLEEIKQKHTQIKVNHYSNCV